MNTQSADKKEQMSRFEHTFWLQVVKLIDVVLVTIPFALCWCLYYTSHLKAPYYWKGNVVMIALYALVYLFMTKVYDGLKVSLYRISEMIYSQVLAMLISDGLLYIVICILYRKLAVLWPGLLCIAGQNVLIAFWAAGAHTWYFKTFKGQHSAIIYSQREGMENLIDAYGLAKKFDVTDTYTVEASLDHLEELKKFETLFLSGVHSHERNILLKYCVENDINMYVIPRVGDVLMSGAKQMHLFHLPMLRVGRYNPNIFYLGAKRFLDILVSGLALVITSPILLITAIAVKCDGGPVFYKQERLTKDGKVFKVIKFRSMRVDAEKDGIARLSTGDKDDRITKVGHVIRKVRIDELPQLFNILSGNMSLVGPRPERPEIAADYEKVLPEFRLRLQAKAGLTGYAQVYGKYNTTPYDKLMMDLMYIANPSVIEDLKILMATVKILFMPESTEGIAEGQTTAMNGENR